MQELRRVLNIPQYDWTYFNRSLIFLYDKRQGSEYVSCNTYRGVTLIER